jgi:hypothetical protein
MELTSLLTRQVVCKATDGGFAEVENGELRMEKGLRAGISLNSLSPFSILYSPFPVLHFL